MHLVGRSYPGQRSRPETTLWRETRTIRIPARRTSGRFRHTPASLRKAGVSGTTAITMSDTSNRSAYPNAVVRSGYSGLLGPLIATLAIAPELGSDRMNAASRRATSASGLRSVRQSEVRQPLDVHELRHHGSRLVHRLVLSGAREFTICIMRVSRRGLGD